MLTSLDPGRWRWSGLLRNRDTTLSGLARLAAWSGNRDLDIRDRFLVVVMAILPLSLLNFLLEQKTRLDLGARKRAMGDGAGFVA